MNAAVITHPTSKPTKMLQLKGGKLASPKAKKPQPDEEPGAKPKQKRGRKPLKKSAIVVIKYPSASIDKANLGARIDGILDGSEKFQPPQANPVPKVAPRKMTPQKSNAPTHPFFMGKAALTASVQPAATTRAAELNAAPKLPSPRKIAGTPGKIRAQAQAHRASMNPPPTLGPVFGSSKPRTTKYPGMCDAPWPWKAVAHVRGDIPNVANKEQQFLPEMQRKYKQAAVDVIQGEGLIARCSHGLQSTHIVDSLRKPEKLVTTGPGIQKMVAKELRTRFVQVTSASSDSDDPLVRKNIQRSVPHPALLTMYTSIETNLTPFDKFECETLAWTQKYAPKTAIEVLQSGKEAVVLRDWLKSTTITAVDTGTNRPSNGSVKATKPEKKKKRKRVAELDDFIIDDDEELNETSELEELRDDSYNQQRSPQKRSLIRGGLEAAHPSKSGNAVLLSGPNGCGKTATVYAVAKELGFEIFELNSGSRRSGKDVLDKIGDMTENHLVQQVSKALLENKPLDQAKLAETIDSDAPDPKQGSMDSFFKPATVKKKAASKASSTVEKTGKQAQPRQQQRQSLILLEEVDVLFDEDKMFWMTVLTLAGHSKRPIIMTCNDESRLPLQALSLHALLRFTPPPVDLAVDYLLLIAAREGHLLKRASVESLYESRSHDLRGSIMELDQWCQIGVGDTTGGFGWMLDRYPPGIDIDAEGHTLRIASKDTYLSGLGLLSNDLLCSSTYAAFDKEEELVLETCERWKVDVEELLLSHAEFCDGQDAGTGAPISISLLDFERQCSLNSDYDVSCGLGLRSGNNVSGKQRLFSVQWLTLAQQRVDCTLPDLSEKELSNYITDSRHINAEPPPDYTNFNKRLAISMLLQASRLSSVTSNFKQEPQKDQKRSSPLSDQTLLGAILTQQSSSEIKSALDRSNFSNAFDILAEDPSSTLVGSQTYALIASSFDREFSIIVTDLAPFVRIIAAHDIHLEEERLSMSSLLSAGGRSTKKLRMTKASRSAAVGGKRESTRRERWFDKNLNLIKVMETGGRDWAGLGANVVERPTSRSGTSTADEGTSVRCGSVDVTVHDE
jgi:DNA polymerase III delta prime subunit